MSRFSESILNELGRIQAQMIRAIKVRKAPTKMPSLPKGMPIRKATVMAA